MPRLNRALIPKGYISVKDFLSTIKGFGFDPVSKETLYSWIRDGHIKTQQINGFYVIAKTELERFKIREVQQ